MDIPDHPYITCNLLTCSYEISKLQASFITRYFKDTFWQQDTFSSLLTHDSTAACISFSPKLRSILCSARIKLFRYADVSTVRGFDNWLLCFLFPFSDESGDSSSSFGSDEIYLHTVIFWTLRLVPVLQLSWKACLNMHWTALQKYFMLINVLSQHQ